MEPYANLAGNPIVDKTYFKKNYFSPEIENK
jgi:hypothetical protein